MSVPSTMKALVQKHDGYASDDQRSGFSLESLDSYVELSEIDVPLPDKGQVLVKVDRGAVNPSDIMFIKGMYGQPRRKGLPAGFEGCGTVVATGDGADAFSGKRVAFVTGRSGFGSWATYAVADAAMCIPLIDGVSDDDGASMIVNPLTALAMLSIVKAAGSKSFIVTAAASQLCKLIIGQAAADGLSAIGIVRRHEQIDLLKGHGATHVLNQKSDDFGSRIEEVCRAEKPLILLDAVAGQSSAAVFQAMGRGARWIIYGRLEEEPPLLKEPGQLIFQQKRIEGFWLSAWLAEAGEQQRAALAMQAQTNFATGRWKTDVTAVLSLDEARDKLPGALAEPNGKVLLAP
ncbi:zinc-binding dehydrogenase [Notoacmeibacter sp. MSK16QG-6]|uniref:zinc-binding dehydrogenase n=1 Tax=Notoacmeibacter sp. MSK16QG-6 TaxID=2957982 RepID=UPI00209DF0E2|nr:zinc-binding dehydrogenase [Notoacmeibacter sp. MSK16QG-6]MCP1200345.1 zinc-binding dehydrogenase [Notoacmeibacter sp. MSK16QG-6]